MMPKHLCRAVACLQLLFIFSGTGLAEETVEVCGNQASQTNDGSCQNQEEMTESTATATTSNRRMVAEECKSVLAETALPGQSGWGVFTLVSKDRGERVLYGDVVLQVTDPTPASQWDELMQDGFLVPGQTTGAQFEAQKVYSAIPGVGSMARYGPKNMLPFAPRMDEAELTRQVFPGAGAISHFHNYTWFISKSAEAGEELYRPGSMTNLDQQTTEEATIGGKRSPSWLRENGYCLDNIQPKRKSMLKGAGRGVFSNRSMKMGDVLVPVPVLPLKESDLEGNIWGNKAQLVRNYCFGHKNSTVYLYPYGPSIHLVNHYDRPNAKLRWAESTKIGPIDSLFNKNDGTQDLLLELVALRDIKKGEEITVDYGRDWEDAWWSHVRSWEEKNSEKHLSVEDRYAPAAVADDASKTVRTESEQKEHPYGSNVVITCFYKYSDRTDSERKNDPLRSKDGITTYRWDMTRGIYDLKNLRPCKILKRKQNERGRSVYLVRMLNRPDLDPDEIIPENQMHLISHIPRAAIRFVDKPYTSDQHLKRAFRREIGLDVFPEEWIDLR